jgi:transposase
MNDLKEWLVKKYWEEGLSQSAIAKIMNSSQSSVQRWMKKFNIKTREPSKAFLGKNLSVKHKQKIREARLKNNPGAFEAGENHRKWKGGKRDYWRRIAYKIWEDYWRQKVPEGYLLHHMDRNYRNNDICNIPLLTLSFHTSLHRRET